MKHLSSIQKQRHAALSRKRNGHRIKRKYGYVLRVLKNNQSISDFVRKLVSEHPKANIIHKRGAIELNAPTNMRLSADKEEIFDFLHCIRKLSKTKAKQKSINFSTISDLSPLCAMLLASEVHRLQLISGNKLRVLDADEWNPSVKQLLHDIGLFELVSVQNPLRLAETETEEKFIRIRSEKEVRLEVIDRIEQEVSNIAVLLNCNPLLYGGIEEAVTNVTQWAYKGYDFDAKERVMENRWWFFASYNKNTGRITLMVYDHGLGIPSTLPISKWNEQIRKWLDDKGIKKYTDEKIIEAAMKFPRSASGEEYRAKGLRKMKELLDRFDRGTLMVLSGRGEYKIDSHGVNETIKLNKHSIGGTLIVWEVYNNLEQAHD